jgi:hypothetical protein
MLAVGGQWELGLSDGCGFRGILWEKGHVAVALGSGAFWLLESPFLNPRV